MAPQILFKNKYTYKADIFSLGVMIFKMFYKEYPWDSSDIQNYFQEIKKPLIFPENPNISKNFKDLLKGMLEFNENKRFDLVNVLTHPFFNNFFNIKEIINTKNEKLINILKEKLLKEENPLEFFNISFDSDFKGYFNNKDFYEYFVKNGFDVNQEECLRIFNLIDFNKENKITFENLMKFISTRNNNDQNLNYNFKNDQKILKILFNLKKFIIYNGINLEAEFYARFSDENNEILAINKVKFKEMMLEIYPYNLNSIQIEEIFTFFNRNNEKLIDFNYFNDFLNDLKY